MAVLLIGTLDTKGAEVAFLRDQLQASGLDVLVIDAGVLGTPAFPADIPRGEVFQAAGANLAQVTAQGHRGEAITQAAAGVAKIAARLQQQGKVQGVLAIGGSAGTTIGTAAMRELPLGIPKVMVSTLASGDVRPFVGTRDIHMVHSVVDIAGLNRISRVILGNAAAALVGMVQRQDAPRPEPTDKPLIAATMFGVTTPCVQAARTILEAAGYEVLVFHATGIGGQTMEGLIRDGLIAGVLDITTTELADEFVGGVMAAGPNRLTAAGVKGIPQVISVGALDMVNFGPLDSVPQKFRDRRLHQHNANVTLMRTTPEELDRIGQQLAEKACAAAGPTRVLLPLQGISAIDAPGQPFHWPEADTALFQSIRNWIYPPQMLEELDCHINDTTFAEAAAQTLLKLMAERPA